MKNYVKPIVLTNEEMAEGVYASSGCYTFTARIVQTPELGNEVYTIQIDGKHEAVDGHHSSERDVVITFSAPVSYVSSNAASVSGDGTNVLRLMYVDGTNGAYHNNGLDNIGLGQLKVKSIPGLTISGVSSDYCNHKCTYDGH